MEITASLSLSELYDPIREMWVAATPEEEVRQRLIALMIHSLGFPRGLLAVERSLDHLCRHLGSHSKLSNILSKPMLFYVTIAPFVAFFALFAFVLYPFQLTSTKLIDIP